MDLKPPDRFTAVTAGTQRTCALRDDKAVICWNSDLESAAIVPPGKYDTVPSSTVGPWLGHSCALRDDKAVICWGANEDGQSDPPERGLRSRGRRRQALVRARRRPIDRVPGATTTTASPTRPKAHSPAIDRRPHSLMRDSRRPDGRLLGRPP